MVMILWHPSLQMEAGGRGAVDIALPCPVGDCGIHSTGSLKYLGRSIHFMLTEHQSGLLMSSHQILMKSTPLP